MSKLTETRVRVLRLTDQPHGLHPTGTDEWTAIYWLEDQGYVESDGRSRSRRRYKITEAGHRLLAEGIS